MNLWRKIELKSASWKKEANTQKKKRKTDWRKDGELKGIRTVDKRYLRPH